MENKKIIIGLVGRICAGKGTVSDHIASKHGAAVLSFSEPMRDILRILHQDVTRPNIQKLSLTMRNGFGEDVFSRAVRGEAENRSEQIIILDPIRRPADMEAFLDGSLIMVAVTRNNEGRYQSMLTRNREKNDSNVTMEEFHKLDTAESEKDIDGLVAKADHILENNGSVAELLAKTDALIADILAKN